MDSFFKFFIVILILAIAVFMIICTDNGYECALPNGGYFRLVWKSKEKKFDVFYWQPKTKAKPIPKKAIVIEGEKEKKKPEPEYF